MVLSCVVHFVLWLVWNPPEGVFPQSTIHANHVCFFARRQRFSFWVHVITHYRITGVRLLANFTSRCRSICQSNVFNLAFGFGSALLKVFSRPLLFFSVLSWCTDLHDNHAVIRFLLHSRSHNSFTVDWLECSDMIAIHRPKVEYIDDNALSHFWESTSAKQNFQRRSYHSAAVKCPWSLQLWTRTIADVNGGNCLSLLRLYRGYHLSFKP